VGLSRALGAAPTQERPRLADGRLIGSRCAACGGRSWPARAVCARCGSDDVRGEPLPGTGTLLSYTSVHVTRSGLPVPYVLGQVSLGDGAAVFGHVRGLPADAHVPLEVRLVVPDDGDTLAFWFEPVA